MRSPSTPGVSLLKSAIYDKSFRLNNFAKPFRISEFQMQLSINWLSKMIAISLRKPQVIANIALIACGIMLYYARPGSEQGRST